ncbi:MAG: permease, partial [bacterium]|nr:permease [bacterium]
EESRDLQCNEACCTGGSDRGKIYQALHYGFVNLPGDIGKSLLAGLAIAGVIAAMVPDNFLAGNLGEGLAAKLLMMLVGLPVYVCATASVPVAAALIFKGISPGAALVFLMTGPATNAAAFTTVWKIMGKMTAIVYLVTVAVVALIAGTVLDYLYTTQGVSAAPAMGEMLPDSVKIVSSFVLLAVLGAAFFRSVSSQAGTCGTGLDEGGDSNTVLEKATLIVSGMTCGHCVQTVTRTLAEGAGITNVSVDLKSGIAVVDGRELDVPELTNAVRELGYEVEIKEHQIGPEDEEKADNESSLADRKCSGTCCSGES